MDHLFELGPARLTTCVDVWLHLNGLDAAQAANVLRKHYQIHVKGSNVTPPLQGFEEVKKKRKFYEKLLANTKASGFTTPTPVQRQVLPLLLHHREVLAVAPTGSGKTLAYLLPIIIHAKVAALRSHQGIKALVMSPTRELAEQITRVLLRLVQGLHLSCCLINSAAVVAGTDFSKTDIAVATPLRLSKVAKQTDLSSVRYLILDEADKLFEEGLFKQTDRVIKACSHPRLVVALFSATLPESVEELARSILRDPVRVTVGQRNVPASAVEQRLVYVGQEAGKLMALRDALRSGLRPPVLVFVNSRQRATVLHRDLALEGVRVASISAEQTPAARTDAVDRFREGHIHVLVCTDLMARGIDFINVQTVVNYDFPQSAVDYIHRVGRTGRAHRHGEAITFFEEKDSGQLRRIANLMQSSGMAVPDWMRNLRKEKPHLKQLKHDKRKAQAAATATGAAKQQQLGQDRKRRKPT
ncbi:g1528 [Coccomyxa viridis]|uniref:RNA helicase n=1 Tax=Coccomyxa viridis TaxID=1274662 RepID=A0ABP1FI67_9CHLO